MHVTTKLFFSGFTSPRGASFIFMNFSYKVPFLRNRSGQTDKLSMAVICLDTIFFNGSGVGLSPLYCGHFRPIVPAPDDR
jgi:hypothetical protein